MATPTVNSAADFNKGADKFFEAPKVGAPRGRYTHKEKTKNHNIKVEFGKTTGGQTRGDQGSSSDRHQGDGLIATIERIEFRSDKDILALGKAINHLGRELHLILGMRAEEVQGVLSTYKGKWYTFGAGSKVKAKLVAAHLKVGAEAAKAVGVSGLKMAHAFDRWFVKPEQEARRKANGQKGRSAFTISGD